MSDAINVASRNFSTTFACAYKNTWNPLRAVSRGVQRLADKAADDLPELGLYRHNIGGHLVHTATVGPRYGAKRGAKVAGAVHGLFSYAKTGMSSKPEVDKVDEPAAIRHRSAASVVLGVTGTLLGGLIGLGLKSAQYVAHISLYLGCMGIGAAVGTAIGLPKTALYALYVGSSGAMQASLRERRKDENDEAVMSNYSTPPDTEPNTPASTDAPTKAEAESEATRPKTPEPTEAGASAPRARRRQAKTQTTASGPFQPGVSSADVMPPPANLSRIRTHA